MKKFFLTAALALLLITAVTGCAGDEGLNEKDSADGKLQIITTLFPQYDFARQIAGDQADVVLLLPPGTESHAYDPTPQDVAKVQKCDMFIYTGEYMEPWAHKIIEGIRSADTIVVDASENITLLDELDEHHEEEPDGNSQEEAHQHGGKDPHIWLDPLNAIIMVDNITAGLIQADPVNADLFRKNASAYKLQLQDLDRKFAETFKKTKYDTIIYGGHFAFGYFAKRYDLEYLSPYGGFSPDAEPTPQKIAELIKNMEASGSKTIYYEELIDPKVARVIADQTGVEMLLLHGAHNVTRQELDAGVTYIGIMQDNMEKLKTGLGYIE